MSPNKIQKSKKRKTLKTNKKKTSKKTMNRKTHDSFFRGTYQDKSYVLDLFQIILTRKEYSLFDWNTLQTELTTYFNKNWKEESSDLVFSVSLKEAGFYEESKRNQKKRTKRREAKFKGDNRVRFIFLFEHKSYRDPNVIFQLLQYQYHIYMKKEKIPVVPVIFYHGREEWNIPSEFKEFLLFDGSKFYRDQCNSLLKGMLNFKCRLLNLRKKNIEYLPKTMTTRSILFFLKYIGEIKKNFDVKYVEKCFKLSKHLTLGQREDIMKECYGYILRFIPNLKTSIVEDIEKKVFRAGGYSVGAFKLYVEEQKGKAEKRGIKKGREEGREEGREKTLQEIIFKMLKRDVDIRIICQLTGLSRDQVFKFQKKRSLSIKTSK